MKNRILTFISGFLTGAIIMALVFLVINKQNKNIIKIPPYDNGHIQRPKGNMFESPEKPDGDMQMPPQ